MGSHWRIKELLYVIGAGLLILGVTAIVTLLGSPSGTTAGSVLEGLDGNKNELYFIGHIYDIDISARTVTASWIVGACGSLKARPYGEYYGGTPACGPPGVPLAIYLDGEVAFNYDPEEFQPRDLVTNDTMYIQSQLQFEKTHLLDIQVATLPGPGTVFDQAFWYPFDFYHGVTNIFALNTIDNTSLPITRVVFTDSVDNFKPNSIEVPSRTVFNGTLVDSRTSTLQLRRTTNAKLYTLVLFIVNWALTVLVAYITLLTQLGVDFGEGIIVLPLTIILTLPTIRGLFVENPPFGILLDSLGLVLQMIIVSLCSIFILVPKVAKTNEVELKRSITMTR